MRRNACHYDSVIIYLRQTRRYMRSPVTFVCLSVSKITQKRVHGFGWNFSCRQAGVGTWTNWSTFENLNVEHLLKSVKHSEQATGHRMHCLLHVVVQGPAPSFLGRSTFLYDVRWRSYGASNFPNFWILVFFGGSCAPLSALLVCWRILYTLQQVAELIKADPKEIVFTSGATESNNIAVKGVARFYKDKRKHVITSQTVRTSYHTSCDCLSLAFLLSYIIRPIHHASFVQSCFCVLVIMFTGLSLLHAALYSSHK